uniref:Uncharacterized protein n=1 Tax=Aegilops tauschii subsp. strangulata TaxID=200361 RepID=A0A453A1P1_AEGTS
MMNYSITSPDFPRKWMGESEKLAANMFDMACENVPFVVYIEFFVCPTWRRR